MDTCINCPNKLNALDDDPNGDKNCVCAKCRAEEKHDFDVEPNAQYDRAGRRIVEPQSPQMLRECVDPSLYWVVELECGVWLSSGEGDPARTLVIDNAKPFSTMAIAQAALTRARQIRRFTLAQVYKYQPPPTYNVTDKERQTMDRIVRLERELEKALKSNEHLSSEWRKYRYALNCIAHPDSWGVVSGHEVEIATRALLIGVDVAPLPPDAKASKKSKRG